MTHEPVLDPVLGGRVVGKIAQTFFADPENNNLSVFLCGAASNSPNSLRSAIKDDIIKVRSKYSYQVFYPEDLFEELVRGHASESLLKLENILADSVDLVVILVESAGTLAELGAFSNHPKLKDKLAVFLDAKHRTDRSFINLGPVKHLRKATKSLTNYQPFGDPNAVSVIADLCREQARKAAKLAPAVKSFANPILSTLPIYALVSVFFPIKRVDLESLIERCQQGVEIDSITISVTTCINRLINEGLITNRGGFLNPVEMHDVVFKRSVSKLATAEEYIRLTNELRILHLNKNLRTRNKHPLQAQMARKSS